MNPVEIYLTDLWQIHATGAAVPETSYYGPLAALLNQIGATLTPKVRCIVNISNRGAGIPDGGLFTAHQFQRGSESEPPKGQLPERGVIEIKSTRDDAWTTADSGQVAKYLRRYGLVLVTNYRDFVLLGQDDAGNLLELETFRFALDEHAFWELAARPKAAAEKHGERLVEYLKRVLMYTAPLAIPEDVAWFLASYARDAKARIEHADLPALNAVRAALEEALGLRFEGEKGDHFFRSTLVQTLFYGVFSSWVLWCKEDTQSRFDWKQAAWSLHVPMIRALFEQVAAPTKLQPLGLVEPLDWAAGALNRVNRDAFFAKFDEGHAVQYFYEPFLERFDPELRKEMGVWYTPPEIVQYMVARVDAVLREELDIPDGLADPSVHVLDPCCGTAAYLVEVLRVIAATLKAKKNDALLSQDLKRAATERIFGFELMPAPFVVAHLQLGLLLQRLGAPLSHAQSERVAVYLTNALTGWESAKGPKQHLLFSEMEEERDAANDVKQAKPILVILGNPPYNGYAGMAIGEERDLSEAYRATLIAPAPQGQGLNELYIRFFRMAERKIVEGSGQGIIAFISNYSWLDGLSHTGMREKYLDVFDNVWIDCLNGDKYKTGKLTPEGTPDPSVFSTATHPVGIQVGTAIAVLLRKKKHCATNKIRFRHFWGKMKREDLLKSLRYKNRPAYATVVPPHPLGFPFVPSFMAKKYLDWPSLPDLFPLSFPGVKTARDPFVVDIDKDRLLKRLALYFDPAAGDEEIRRIAPVSMKDTARFSAKETRQVLLKRGFLRDNIVPYTYRPFDTRWLYWEPRTKLLDEKRTEYFPHCLIDNLWIAACQQNRKSFDPPYVTKHLSSSHIIERGANLFPLYLDGHFSEEDLFSVGRFVHDPSRTNLSSKAEEYLDRLGKATPEELFLHAIATMHAPAYCTDNASALRQYWPRIPLPKSKTILNASAGLGRNIAGLLDAELPVKGVTAGGIRPELKTIGPVSCVGGGPVDLHAGGLELRAGWGHDGKDGVTMPGKGRLTEREYSPEERSAIALGAKADGLTPEAAFACLGESTFDIFLNDTAYWCNIPRNVWEYSIGGYQVIKKWLSYREFDILERPLTIEEVRDTMNIARRIAAILLLHPLLDASYEAVKSDT